MNHIIPVRRALLGWRHCLTRGDVMRFKLFQLYRDPLLGWNYRPETETVNKRRRTFSGLLFLRGISPRSMDVPGCSRVTYVLRQDMKVSG